MILADNETKVDLLNNEAIATTIIKLLRDRPDRPITVGVHGDWGAGKSSILEMIEAGFEGESEILCLKFNGWRFQGFEDAKIALIEGIVTGLIEKRPALTKAADAVKDIFRRIDWLKVAKKAGGLAFTAFTGVPSPDLIHTVLGAVQGVLADPAKLATKEILNTLFLRQRTAEARGFGDDIKLPILAKLMLAERFLPRLFDQIAATAAASPDGKCADLVALETAATGANLAKTDGKKAPATAKSGDGGKTSKLEVVTGGESGLLREWMTSPATQAWAKVQPSVGDQDIRPYLFVAKDRKDYFGAASVLGHLAAIVERLFGGKLAVQALEADLKRLAQPEATQVFEAVRGRIVASDTFDIEPPGVAGLGV